MNRREFVKALAGVSLLGLLVKLPEAEEEATLTFVDSGLYGLNAGKAEDAGKGVLDALRSSGLAWQADEELFAEPPNGVYSYIGDSEPFLTTMPSTGSTSVLMWYNGKEYVRVT